MGTVPFYAILDTGLTYTGINPATGWTGERCVLLAARQSGTERIRLNATHVARSDSGSLASLTPMRA